MKTSFKYFSAIILSLVFRAAIFGQELPPVGTIDFYGLQSVSAEKVRSVMTIKTGDEWMKTIMSIEENRRRLKTLPNVEDAAISLVCCDGANGKSIVFVGIREKGIAPLAFRPAPSGTIRLPENVVQAGRDFQKAFMQAAAARDFSEDRSQGHALTGNKNVRAVQERFIVLAAENAPVLRRVLRESGDAGQRALAAQIIAYTKDKRKITDDLLYAVTDANEDVRNNATRALILIVDYANSNPQLKINIPADRFIKMLDSVDWTDRNKSLGVLDSLTKKRDPALLARLKKNSLASLTEMARWKSQDHAQSAFSILARLAAFSETEIENLWKSAERENKIETMLQKINASK